MYPVLKIMHMLNFLDTFSMGITKLLQHNYRRFPMLKNKIKRLPMLKINCKRLLFKQNYKENCLRLNT